MVELWGNLLSLIGSIVSAWIGLILLDAFFPRKKFGKSYCFFVTLGISVFFVFSLFVGSSFGYASKILFEVASYYALCALLYQSRWDRRLFVIVTTYAVLYSSAYWLDALCMYALNLTYEEYIWNVPLYSAVFLLRPLSFLVVALIIRKYHPPLSVGKQARAWVSLSVVFPLSTLLIIWQIYTFPNEQQIWHFCLLILDVVDVVFLLLLDHLEQSAVNREKLPLQSVRMYRTKTYRL